MEKVKKIVYEQYGNMNKETENLKRNQKKIKIIIILELKRQKQK